MSRLTQWKVVVAAVAAACAGIGAASAEPASPDASEAAFRELYKELVEINTTRSVGSCTQAAEAMRRDCSRRASRPRTCRSSRRRRRRRTAR